MNNDQRNNIIRLAIGFGVAIALLAIVGLLFFNKKDDVGTGIEYSPPDGPAIMTRSEDLYDAMNNDQQFNLLKNDVAVYARKSVEPYSSGTNPVVFEVTSVPAKVGATISFEGRFVDSSDTVTITIERLKSNRMKLSITNKTTGSNIDDQLPSNSRVNQFIGTLPVSEGSYHISYVASSNRVVVAIYSRDPAIYDQAFMRIQAAVGEENIDELNITATYPTASFTE